MPSQSPDGRTWYSVNEAAALMGVSRRTIYHWLKDGRLDTRWTPSGQVRIAGESILAKTKPASKD